MITVKIPTYMLGNEDKINNKDVNYACILLNQGTNVKECLNNAAKEAPNAFSNFLDDNGGIKRSCIVVHNETVIDKRKASEIATADADEIEVLLQLAGG